jgi:hypothetical protein
MFPEAIESPPLVPEEIDQEAPLPVAKVMPAADTETLVERVTVSEHFMLVEYVAVRPPEHRARPHGHGLELVA